MHADRIRRVGKAEGGREGRIPVPGSGATKVNMQISSFGSEKEEQAVWRFVFFFYRISNSLYSVQKRTINVYNLPSSEDHCKN